MQNQEIIKIIDNLKSRRKYEEKKAAKLGFNSLYEYFEEDKTLKQKNVIEAKEKELELIKKQNKFVKKEKNLKKTCGCC